jgi:poly(hydroxyalkanoate) granule-associated protein
MATKKAKTAKTVKRSARDSSLVDAVRESAHQIWMAGLGAFAKAQEERDKMFDKVFDALVREGNAIQKRTKALTEEKMSEVSNRVSVVSDQVAKVAGQVQKEATERWDKLESVFEARVERALRRLGVPTMKDVQALQRRVDQVAGAKQAPAKRPAKKVVRKAVKAAPKVARAAAK